MPSSSPSQPLQWPPGQARDFRTVGPAARRTTGSAPHSAARSAPAPPGSRWPGRAPEKRPAPYRNFAPSRNPTVRAITEHLLCTRIVMGVPLRLLLCLIPTRQSDPLNSSRVPFRHTSQGIDEERLREAKPLPQGHTASSREPGLKPGPSF